MVLIVGQVRTLLISLLVEELKHIPIPKIEGTSENYDYRIEDLALSGHDLLPEHIHVRVENDMRFDMGKLNTEAAKANVIIRATHIKTVMENVKFWFRRRGLIDIQDEGIAAAALKGDGASISIHLKMDLAHHAEGAPLFRVKRVDCQLDDLHIHVLESKYDWILNLFSGVIAGNLKVLLEGEIEGAVQRAMEGLERQLSNLLDVASPMRVTQALASAASSTASSIMS